MSNLCSGKVNCILYYELSISSLNGTIIVDKTTFYGTMGGQEGDIGTIKTADVEFVVENTIHLAGTIIVPFSPSDNASTISSSLVSAVTFASHTRFSYPTNSVASFASSSS